MGTNLTKKQATFNSNRRKLAYQGHLYPQPGMEIHTKESIITIESLHRDIGKTWVAYRETFKGSKACNNQGYTSMDNFLRTIPIAKISYPNRRSNHAW
jgi:hypothetical protein